MRHAQRRADVIDIETALLEAPSSLSQAIRSVQAHVLNAGRAAVEKAEVLRGQRKQAVLTDTESLTESLRVLLQSCDAMMGTTDSQSAVRTQSATPPDRNQTQSLFETRGARASVALRNNTVTVGADARSSDMSQLLSGALLALYFIALRWQRSLQWTVPENYRHIVTVASPRAGAGVDRAEQHVTIVRRCIDSGQYSAQIMAEHRAVVRFSGTVSPLELYQRLHGQLDSADAGQAVTSVALRARTPFSSEQIKVLAVTDINTFYCQRQQTLT